MCRQEAADFQPHPAAAHDARRFVTETCRRWGLQDLAEDLELAVSELVTNAVLHTNSALRVMLAVARGVVELAVHDGDPRPPVLRPVRRNLLADIDAAPTHPYDVHDPRHPSLHVGPAGSIAAGRGLLIVDAIADEWGVADRGDGKDVWLRLRGPHDWPYASGCVCAGSQGSSPSGQPVVHVQGPWDTAHRDS